MSRGPSIESHRIRAAINSSRPPPTSRQSPYTPGQEQDGVAKIPEDDDRAEGDSADDDQDGEDGVHPEPEDR
ncbi:hypothetical protein PtB15_15B399 [Puccinia triticina]|nr:hypothetical protein PtB15_15B399 [Puccinia triticina]